MKPMCQKSPAARALEETVAKSQARESARIQHECFGSSKPSQRSGNRCEMPTLEERAKAIGLTWEMVTEDEDGERWYYNPKINGKGVYAIVSQGWILGCIDYAEAMNLRRAFDAT